MDTASQPEIRVPGKKPWRVIFRVLLLLATAVSLYFLFPSLVDLFTQWHSLAHLKPEWLLLALVFEATSVTALWEVQRIALRTPSWFAVGTSQLAGNAAGNVIPGGAATSGAFTYRLLVRAGVRRDDVAAGLASVSIANTTMILAFPVLALIPFTPGGLGFVEAGLTGLLTLAGASAHQAVVATLAYRLLTFWLLLPLGGIAYLLHRRRYGTGGASASATSP